jgi:hypothetical protein
VRVTVKRLNIGEYPDAKDVLKQVQKLLSDIVFFSRVHSTPQNTKWKQMKKGDEQNRIHMWTGRNQNCALSGMYTVMLCALKETL